MEQHRTSAHPEARDSQMAPAQDTVNQRNVQAAGGGPSGCEGLHGRPAEHAHRKQQRTGYDWFYLLLQVLPSTYHPASDTYPKMR